MRIQSFIQDNITIAILSLSVRKCFAMIIPAEAIHQRAFVWHGKTNANKAFIRILTQSISRNRLKK
jgi:hypothetical protein